MDNINGVRSEAVEPFLVRYSTPRIGSEPTSGHYSALKNMWVVERKGEDTPLIEADGKLAELSTKTRATSESDD